MCVFCYSVSVQENRTYLHVISQKRKIFILLTYFIYSLEWLIYTELIKGLGTCCSTAHMTQDF